MAESTSDPANNINLNPPLPDEVKQWIKALKKGKILRYRIDIISVITVLAAVMLQFIAYWYRWPWYSFALIPIIILMCPAHLVEHNHAHLTLFRATWLNEFFGWLMFLNCGVPLQVYREQHVKTHHQQFATPKDWTSPWAFQGTVFPDKPVSKWYYVLTFMPISFLQCIVNFLRKPGKGSLYFFLSVFVVATVMTMLAKHDFFYFFLYYLIPWIVTYLYLPHANWGHHIHCEHDSVYTTAMNDFNFHGRALGFNIGYHTAHHWAPYLHWSLLPKLHKEFLAAKVSSRYYVPIGLSKNKK